MKNFLLLILLLFTALSTSQAQQHRRYDPERLEAARVAFITTRLDLTASQAQEFWPIFNEFTAHREAHFEEMSQLTRMEVESELTEEEAKQQIQTRFRLHRSFLEQEERFLTEAAAIIGYPKVIKLQSIQRDFTKLLYRKNPPPPPPR